METLTRIGLGRAWATGPPRAGIGEAIDLRNGKTERLCNSSGDNKDDSLGLASAVRGAR